MDDYYYHVFQATHRGWPWMPLKTMAGACEMYHHSRMYIMEGKKSAFKRKFDSFVMYFCPMGPSVGL